MIIVTAGAGLALVLYLASVVQHWQPLAPATGPSIDLALQRWYVRAGFAAADAAGFDPLAPDVRTADHFPIRLNALFAVPADNTVHAFTLMTFFDWPAEAALASPLLSLPELGENWAVYLNGVEIRREIYLGPDGQITLRRSLQKALVPLPATALRPGINTLVFQMLGSAPPSRFYTDWMPGFSMERRYYVGPAARLLRQRALENAVAWFQIGAYLFFCLHHLLMFMRQRERFALYFSGFLLTCVVYSLTNSSLIFEFLPDTAFITRLRLFSVIAWPALIGLTLWCYLYPDLPAPPGLRAVSLAMAAGCGLTWAVPLPWTGLVLIVYLPAFAGAAVYVVRFLLAAHRQGRPDARRLLVAGLGLLALAAVVVVDVYTVRSGVDVAGWIPFLLAATFALIFVDRFWRLSSRLAESNRQLQLSHDHLEEQVAARSAELRAANAELEQRVVARTAELSLARDAAEAANRAKTAFLAVMGHELRTPLHGIFLTAEILRERDQPLANQVRYADIILASGRRLLQMVEGVLEYTATSTPARQPVDLDLAFNESAVRFGSRAAQRKLTLSFTMEAPVPRLMADPLQFDRILRRLLDNAVKFTPAGGQVRVEARGVPGDPGGVSGVEIAVFNSGAPLAPADYERMFEPFIQLEASHLEHVEGAGLGLTLARRQAEAHGGTLTAAPAPAGDGHVFTLRLPAA